jgi:hypothetical protein
VPFRTFAFVQPMVDSNPIAYVDITQDDLSSMMSRIIKVAHDQWRGDISPKKDSDGCSQCFLNHACAKFKPSGGGVFAPKRRRIA